MEVNTKNNNRKLGGAIVALGIIVYIILFGFLSLWKYYNFHYNALDLAIINQVFYNSSLGNVFASSIHPPTYLGDHFTPILFLLLPFYFLWSRPETLLIIQTIFLGLSAWPIYLIAKNVLSKKLAVFVALAWLVNPIVQNINLFEWHFLPLAIFFILWAFYFWQKDKIIPFAIFILLALLVREDVALVIFMFGALSLLKKKKVRWVALPIVLSIIYFISSILTTNALAPGNGYKFFIYYTALGNTPTEAIKNIGLKPWIVVSQALRPNNFIFFVGLLLPTMLIPLFSPIYLLLGLIIFIQLALGGSGGGTTLLQTHYSALLLPAVFIAFIYGLKNAMASNHEKIKLLLTAHRSIVIIIIIIGIAYTSIALGPLPGVTKIMPSYNSSRLKQMLNVIPPEATVASSYKTLANLSSREKIYSVNYAWLGKQQFLSTDYSLPEDTEFIVFDFKDLITYQLQYGYNQFYSQQYQASLNNWTSLFNGFGLIDMTGSIGLYQKNQPDQIELISYQPEGLINNRQDVVVNDEIIFLGNNLDSNKIEIFWQIRQPLEKTYRLKFIAEKNGKRLAESIYPFAYDLLETDVPGTKKIQTNYWLEFNKNLPDDYDVKFQILTVEDGGIEIDGIRSTHDVIDKSYVSEIFSLE